MPKLLIALLLFVSTVTWAQHSVIIPEPVSITEKPGSFTITKSTLLITHDKGDENAALFFNNYLKKYYGISLKKGVSATKNYIVLTTKKFIKAPDKDGYALNITSKGISISGDTYAGGFYGIQSLIQLLPVEKTALRIKNVSIEDYPRFAYRGMHLDVGRHFMPVSFVKRYIDFIALHKMNYFHWHLTEDQGWRIEIKKYPRLTQIGAYRNGTVIGRRGEGGNDNQRYGGFYTQNEIKDVIKYATERHITIVSEIEMPGHSSAAIAAYPWLSCFENEKTKMRIPSEASQQASGKLVQEGWGVFEDVYCAGNDSTFTFLENVLDEVV
ncbi:MAG TPA: beta-N-acetylhexosaminidase, partial [Flavisolibacter sp.]|nr:beta-N-acetylhexosaminidase [Flavisolibacter sp.]